MSQVSSTERSSSRSPSSIVPYHSPPLISMDRPQFPPPPSLSSVCSEGCGRFGSSSPEAIPSIRASTSQRVPLPQPGSLASTRPPHASFRSDYEYPISHNHTKTEVAASASSHVPVTANSCAVSFVGEPPSESVHPMTYVAAFVLDTLPRQMYLYFLLRLPYLYFSRVTRIFEEAEMTMPQIKQGILEAAIHLKEPVNGIVDARKLEPVESVQYSKLQNTWQSFIDSLMREWKTLNIISVLLLS